MSGKPDSKLPPKKDADTTRVRAASPPPTAIADAGCAVRPLGPDVPADALTARLLELCGYAGIDLPENPGGTLAVSAGEIIRIVSSDPDSILKFFSAWVLSDWLRFEKSAASKDAMKLLFDVAALRKKDGAGVDRDMEARLRELLARPGDEGWADEGNYLSPEAALGRVRLTPAGIDLLKGIDEELNEADALEEPYALDGGGSDDDLGGLPV